MNIGQLKSVLAGFPDEWVVCLASDEEGSAIRVLCEVDLESFIYDNGYEVDAVHPDDIPEFYQPDDVSHAVILWP